MTIARTDHRASLAMPGIIIITFTLAAHASEPLDSASRKSESTSERSQKEELIVRLRDAELLDIIASDAAQMADSWARERETRLWAAMGLIVTLVVTTFGFIGIRSLPDLRKKVFSDLRQELRTDPAIVTLIQDEVRQRFVKDVEARLNRLSKESAFYQFWNQANEISQSDRFPRSLRDSVVESLAGFRDSDEILETRGFAHALEKTLDSFVAAGLDGDIDAIDDTLGHLAERAPGITHTMVAHYGRRVLGEVSVSSDVVVRFRKYCNYAKRNDRWEIALPFLLVYEHAARQEGFKTRIEGYLQDAEDFDAKEREVFVKRLTSYVEPTGITETPNAFAKRIAEKFRSFMSDYGDRVVAPASGGSDGGSN